MELGKHTGDSQDLGLKRPIIECETSGSARNSAGESSLLTLRGQNSLEQRGETGDIHGTMGIYLPLSDLSAKRG